MKLLVRNIDRGVTESQLQELFAEYGTVQSCSLVLDKEKGGSKGFGFVVMRTSGEAKAATKSLNGKEINGMKIRVKKAVTSEKTAP